jgi:pyruvate formate lyase activating enzyme
MQGLIFDVRRFSVHDGPGIRTTVFFKGCPLQCRWCHNPESRKAVFETAYKSVNLDGVNFQKTETLGYFIEKEDLKQIIEKDRIFYDESGGGVTFSGGEPTMQPEFLLELAKSCKDEGIHTSLDTSGYAPASVFKQLIPFIDLFLYDIKVTDSVRHQQYTDVDNKLIISNLSLLSEKEVIIRYPVIPGINDSTLLLDQLLNLLRHVPLKRKEIHFLPYHRMQRSKYQRLGLEYTLEEISEPSSKEMQHISDFFEEDGYVVKIGG